MLFSILVDNKTNDECMDDTIKKPIFLIRLFVKLKQLNIFPYILQSSHNVFSYSRCAFLRPVVCQSTTIVRLTMDRQKRGEMLK